MGDPGDPCQKESRRCHCSERLLEGRLCNETYPEVKLLQKITVVFVKGILVIPLSEIKGPPEFMPVINLFDKLTGSFQGVVWPLEFLI